MLKTCRVCDREFVLRPGKPGYANVCLICTDEHEELEYPVAAQAADTDGYDFQITTRGQLNRMLSSRRGADN